MMNNYIVKLNNIKIKSSHGLYEAEKENDQSFEVDIAISFSKQTCSDDIDKTINYQYVYGIILDVFKNNTFNLIETLGEKIIDKVLVVDCYLEVRQRVLVHRVDLGHVGHRPWRVLHPLGDRP